MHSSLKNSLVTVSALALLTSLAPVRAQAPAEKPPQPPTKPAKMEKSMDDAPVTSAVAVLVPTAGNDVKGTVTFQETAEGIHVKGKITGLQPGPHGFHIHQFGDISSKDGKSAGGHFNPTDEAHGAPGDKMRHVGDLGNIEADKKGVATVDVTDKELKFKGKTSILGRGVVVHAGTDDLKSQPSGDAGARVAVGVIGVAKK